MSKTLNHTGKSRIQREMYKTKVNQTEIEQTLNQNLSFDNSDNVDDFDDNSSCVLPLNFKQKVTIFFKTHMFEVISGIVGLIFTVVLSVITIFAINLNRESGEHSIEISNLKEKTTENKSLIKDAIEDYKSEDKKINMEINELKISDTKIQKDIEYLQKDLQRIESGEKAPGNK